MLISAGAGGATATVNSVDTSGTDATASTSQVQTGTTVHMNNTSGAQIYQVIATNSTEDPVTKVVDNGTGFVAATNASMVNVSAGSEGSHWNATIQESSLEDVEHTIGENVTVEFRAYNNSSAETADVNTTAYLLFDNSTTVQNIDDSDVEAEVPVFYEEASDDVDEDQTYAVYKKVGGTWALSVNLGDSFEDADDVSVNAIGSAGASTMAWQYITASSMSTGFINAGAMLGMVPVAAGRRQSALPA